jgi:hypothetical protein
MNREDRKRGEDLYAKTVARDKWIDRILIVVLTPVLIVVFLKAFF